MFILHFLPDNLILWFTNLLLLSGIALVIAGFFANRIPLITSYQLPFRILGIALLVVGVYFRGGLAVEQEWRARVAEVEAKLAMAQQKSVQANIQLDTRVIEKTKVIQGKQLVVKQYIDREVVKYDNTCVIPKEFIQAHNDSAERIK